MSGREEDQVKRACSVTAALGDRDPARVAIGVAEGAFFHARVRLPQRTASRPFQRI